MSQSRPTYHLDIRNFQSIKNQSLDFSGFNVICGKSDMGKSALRRSIQTALFNNWSKSFIRTGEKSTLVSLSGKTFSISALKSSTENQFTINDKVYPKMGKDTPEIPNHNFRQELNIATQLEPLYMVSYKDTENTKILNNLFGIDILEKAQYLCQLDLRRTKQDSNYHSDLLSTKEKDYSETKKLYNQLNELLSFYNFTQELITTIQDYKTHKASKSALLKEVDSLQHDYNKTQEQLEALNSILSTHNFIRKTRELENNRQQLNQVTRQLNTISKCTTLTRYLSTIRQLDKLKSHPALRTSFKPIQGISKLLEYYRIKSSGDLISKKSLVSQIDEQLATINLEISKHRCPTCGGAINA